ncbi:MAG TPA: hypothetical protein VHG10_03805 [Glycomyces sp.]|nr:hypothetical protein [Glycomyces sp.]
MLPRRIGATAAALSLTAVAAGCGWFEPEEADLDFEAHEAELTDMYNENIRLAKELDEAEARIVQACLEKRGFTVHNPDQFTSWPEAERESFVDQPPYQWFMPTVEEASDRGFFQWTALDGAEEYEDGALYATFEEFQAAAGWPVHLSEDEEIAEFHYLPPEDQYAWYVAYAGDKWAAENHPDLGGPGRKTDASGDEVFYNPPPEGCLLEMIEAVYGQLQTSENEEEGWTDWTFRPEQPYGDWSAMNERYENRTADAEGDLLDCLDDRGRSGWEFYNGTILVHMYLHEAGEGENALSSHEDSGTRWPDPPQDAPDADDFEGWLAFERELAVDFAECGDESGFREAAEHAWQQAQLRFYLDVEEETFAWQEEMRGHLEKAQEVIGS